MIVGNLGTFRSSSRALLTGDDDQTGLLYETRVLLLGPRRVTETSEVASNAGTTRDPSPKAVVPS
jgi:hypothetical protein